MNRKTKRILIIISCCFFLVWGCEEFMRRVIGGFAGSYPFVESWDINAPEADVIEAIKELKREEPSLQPPNQIELTSKRDTGYNWNTLEMIEYKNKFSKDSLTPLPEHSYSNTYTDYWLYVDFYYADSKQVIHTWTRPDFDSTVTTFAFVSISSLDNPRDRKLINKDFWYIANKRQINKFKRLIVDRIKQRLTRGKAAHNKRLAASGESFSSNLSLHSCGLRQACSLYSTPEKQRDSSVFLFIRNINANRHLYLEYNQ